jgi:carboxylesterase type B
MRHPKNMTIFFKVTIIGNSAGSASVHYLILSPTAKGLFHSAIAQSGSAHNFWAYSYNPAATAFEFGKFLECDITSSKTLVECLKEKTVQELISAQAKLKVFKIQRTIGRYFF